MQYNALKGAILIIVCTLFSFSIAPNTSIEGSSYQERFKNLYTTIPLQWNTDVQKEVEQYLRYEDDLVNIIQRKDLYFPLVQSALSKYQIPEELACITIIESKINPDASDGNGHVGMWQMNSTAAQMFDLKINKIMDERRDPYFSSEAAAQYLKYLHDRFGDWLLAIAAYNCGEGTVSAAIKKSGNVYDYWKIRKHLPSVTRQYIPKLFAAIYLTRFYHEHGINPPMVFDNLMFDEIVTLDNEVYLSEVAAIYNVELADLQRINPCIYKTFIPSEYAPIRIKIPFKPPHWNYATPKDEVYSHIEENLDRKLPLAFKSLEMRNISEVAMEDYIPDMKFENK
ncbi:MAG: lytic transglycosylase domain-containing protein [Chitinophagales bacterium]|nr:lytic transglycosylase domain-containing protein [Bacteroidota bacterium]MCB9044392.1 lytic transglycosylase domain-containing protein [Chitinophagales bacterium]